MADRNPALDRLDVLIGRWTVQPRVDGVGPAWTEFSWQDDGRLLRQFSDVDEIPADSPWREHAPFPVYSVFGYDDATGEFTMLYADGRGVHRVYRMTMADREWLVWRDAPGFNQRFIATLSPDGDTIDGRWEMSEDGENWRVDFALTYTRQRQPGG